MKKLRNKKTKIALLCALLLQAEAVTPDEPFIPDYSVLAPLARGLKPIRRITVSEWAEAYRILGRAVSNQPGAWRNSVTPYLVPIMNALSVFSSYQEIVFMKGAQIGATSVMENFIGYCMHITPGPILLMYPTVSVAKRNSKRRITSLIQDSPVLRNIVSPPKSRDGSNTILEKEFAGGNMMLCGSESPSDLRSVNVRFLGQDEVDEYPLDLADQGDPMELARVRTNSYDDNKKIFIISTPKTKGTSHIEKVFLETDQNHFYVPCPHCAPNMPKTIGYKWEDLLMKECIPGFQKLVLSQFRFTDGNPDAVYYECNNCGKEIHNHHKSYMLPRLRCMADAPQNANSKRIGFHLNAFYSPIGMYSWATMAANYDKAKKDPSKMKTFVQTTLGLPFDEEGMQPAYNALYQRGILSPYVENEIPDEVCFLTLGADVQKDRIELEIVGWGRGKRSYSIRYQVILGKPEESIVWNQLSAILSETWVKKDGTVLGLSMSLIDEGYSKNEVYAFCLAQGLTRILPCKGMDDQSTPISSPKPVWIRRDGKKSNALHHITISTDYYKSALYAHLSLKVSEETGLNGPDLYCHFPKNYQEDHYKSLTIEKKISIPGSRGNEVSKWTKPSGARNEKLDCRVYAMAAASLFGMERFEEKDWLRITGQQPKGEIKKGPPRNTGGLPPMGNLPGL